jgi:hypothetical protein
VGCLPAERGGHRFKRANREIVMPISDSVIWTTSAEISRYAGIRTTTYCITEGGCQTAVISPGCKDQLQRATATLKYGRWDSGIWIPTPNNAKLSSKHQIWKEDKFSTKSLQALDPRRTIENRARRMGTTKTLLNADTVMDISRIGFCNHRKSLALSLVSRSRREAQEHVYRNTLRSQRCM